MTTPLSGAALTTAITEAIGALRTAEAVTGQRPTIILAPGTTYVSTDGGLANANTTLLATIADELGAETIAIADAIYSDIADTVTYAGNNGANQLWIVGQTIQTGEVAALHGSSFGAAAIARNDSENGIVRQSQQPGDDGHSVGDADADLQLPDGRDASGSARRR